MYVIHTSRLPLNYALFLVFQISEFLGFDFFL